jgi:hypothetical protein
VRLSCYKVGRQTPNFSQETALISDLKSLRTDIYLPIHYIRPSKLNACWRQAIRNNPSELLRRRITNRVALQTPFTKALIQALFDLALRIIYSNVALLALSSKLSTPEILENRPPFLSILDVDSMEQAIMLDTNRIPRSHFLVNHKPIPLPSSNCLLLSLSTYQTLPLERSLFPKVGILACPLQCSLNQYVSEFLSSELLNFPSWRLVARSTWYFGGGCRKNVSESSTGAYLLGAS